VEETLEDNLGRTPEDTLEVNLVDTSDKNSGGYHWKKTLEDVPMKKMEDIP
jgi:hypothetical protein